MNTAITFNPPSQLPDADADVLASILRDDGSIEVWEAHCVDGVWWSSNSTMITTPVVSWAHKPDGVDLRYQQPAAAPAPAVPQGWKATPANPDPDMVRAGWECLPSGTTLPWDYGARKCREVWAAMHAAAPSQEPVNGCDYCKHAFYAGLTCPNCGAVSTPSQEPAVNLSCRSTQARLAAQWGYVPAQPQPVTLTDELDKLDVKVSAGLCQVTADGKHAYLREIQVIIAALREKGALR